MLIDCSACAMRATSACDDCVVTFLLGGTPVDLGDGHTDAIRNLSDEGLVSRLRLVPTDRQVTEERQVS